MNITPLSSASPLSAAGTFPVQALPGATGPGASALTAAAGSEAGANDLAELLGSVNSLQSLASTLSGASGSSGTFQPTISPYKPIDPVDQRTVRDSIPDDSQTSGTNAA
jgi:hypothetical protein